MNAIKLKLLTDELKVADRDVAALTKEKAQLELSYNTAIVAALTKEKAQLERALEKLNAKRVKLLDKLAKENGC
jgi:hypothetical protein